MLKACSVLSRTRCVDLTKASQSLTKTWRLSTIRCMSNSQSFEEAIANSTKLKEDPGNDEKLQLYALYKQATVGACNTKKPGAMDFVGKYKWEAWNKLGSISTDEAKSQYVAFVAELAERYGSTAGGDSAPSGADNDDVILTRRDGVLTLRLNRPKKYNALNIPMYELITKSLNEAAVDADINMAVITGTGDFYCAGNDLAAMGKVGPDMDLKEFAETGKQVLVRFVDSFIEFPKPLIMAVNGPCVGISCTTAALGDIIVCSDHSYFSTPFSSTAQSPEGCSTASFPSILGTSRTAQMLMFNHRMSAQEALDWGFVARVIPRSDWNSSLEQWIYGDTGIVKTCSAESMKATKSLIRNATTRESLKMLNRTESDRLVQSWLSPEFPQFIAKFMSRK